MDKSQPSLVVRTTRGSPTAVLEIGGKKTTFNGVIEVECGVCGQRHTIELIRDYPCSAQDTVQGKVCSLLSAKEF